VPVSGTCCGLFGALSVMVTAPVRVPTWVGVKVTLILQFLPAASVAPQGLGLTARAKSPLIPMPLIFRVALPELRTVIDLAALVTPTFFLGKVRDVGVSVTAGPPPPLVTVRLRVVFAVRLPEVPVMVTVEVPRVAVALAVSVSVLVVVVGLGLKTAVTPLGRPEAAKETLPLKPFCGVTVMVLVPLLLRAMESELGFALNVNVGPAVTVTGSELDSMPLATATRL